MSDDADKTPGQAGGSFQGRVAFQQAVRDALDEAASAGCRELLLCDVDFADWPLGEPGVIDTLQRWALSHRRLTMLAMRFDEVPKLHARWVQWRRTWSHIVETREVQHLAVTDMPSLLYAPGLFALRRVDPAWHRGVVDRDVGDLTRTADMVAELQDRSVPAFPVTTLGL